MNVYSEVVPPFNLMPRQLLEAGGNTVMQALVNNMLPMFMQRCATIHWSLPLLRKDCRHAVDTTLQAPWDK